MLAILKYDELDEILNLYVYRDLEIVKIDFRQLIVGYLNDYLTCCMSGEIR